MAPTTMVLMDKNNEANGLSIDNIMQRIDTHRGTAYIAPMISPNHFLASNLTLKEIRKSIFSNDKVWQLLKNQSRLSSRMTDNPVKQRQHRLNATLPILPIRKHGGFEQKSVTLTQPFPEKFYTESDPSLG